MKKRTTPLSHKRSSQKAARGLGRFVALFILIIILAVAAFPPSVQSKMPEEVQTKLTAVQKNVFVSNLRKIFYSAEDQMTDTLAFDPDIISEYTNSDEKIINNDKPFFTKKEIKDFKADAKENKTWTKLSELDVLGRCGPATGCFTKDGLPTEERGAIGHVRPSGWHTVKYDKSVIPDLYLYNRSHLLMYALSGINDDERNLITGTRYFNATLMLKYEMKAVNYVEDHNVPILYRVSPVFDGENLVAKGVLMECVSADGGLQFCRFVYNVQPGITIDYATGESHET